MNNNENLTQQNMELAKSVFKRKYIPIKHIYQKRKAKLKDEDLRSHIKNLKKGEQSNFLQKKCRKI